MSRQVLIEHLDEATSHLQLVEGKDGPAKGYVVLDGVSIQGEIRNQNGRFYPRKEIERAVNTINERIKTHGPIAGELEHPKGLEIGLDRATHVIESMRINNNDGLARFKVIDAGLGSIVCGLARVGWRPGVSSRGNGMLDEANNVSEFDIVTIDIVANPSAPGAYPGLVEHLVESARGRETIKLAGSIQHDPAAQRYFKTALLDFFKNDLSRR